MSFGPPAENLFTYGTLQREEIQLATFGRRLEGTPDFLPAYRLVLTQVRDEKFAEVNGVNQRTVQFTGQLSDFVEGIVFVITQSELERSDTYEPTDYERVRVELKSGELAWVYLQRE